jgi:hypothetical protein
MSFFFFKSFDVASPGSLIVCKTLAID